MYPDPPLGTLEWAYLENASSAHVHTGVCEKNNPLDKKTLRSMSLKSTRSGGGEQFLMLPCRAKARAARVLLSRAPVSPPPSSPRGKRGLSGCKHPLSPEGALKFQN